MATIHVDLYNGNDSNDGSTWALAKKTIPVGSNSNTYKISKTPPGELREYSATWDELSPIVTLDTAKTILLHNSDSDWTRTTPYYAATSNARKIGSSSKGVILNLALNYPIGKIAYLPTLSNINGSAYQKLGFWFQSNNLLAAATYELRICLCSDLTGDVVESSWILEMPSITNSLHYYVLDNNGPLPSSIQSIALYLVSKSTSYLQAYLYFNNFAICNDLHCNKLISNQSGYLGYRAIKAVDGETVYLEDGLLNRSEPIKIYGGPSAYGPVYLMKPFIDLNYIDSTAVYTHYGTYGGWNTETDIVDGITFFDGMLFNQNGLFCHGAYKEIQNLGFSRFVSGTRSFSGGEFTNCIYVSCTYGNSVYGGNPSNPVFRNCYFYGLTTMAFYSATSVAGAHFIDIYAESSGVFILTAGTATNIQMARVNVKQMTLFNFNKLVTSTIEDCSSTGINFTSRIYAGYLAFVNNCLFDNASTSSMAVTTFECMESSIISNCSFSGNVGGVGGAFFHNCIFPSSVSAAKYVSASNFNQVEGDSGVFQISGTSRMPDIVWQTLKKRDEADLGAWDILFFDYGNLAGRTQIKKILDFAYSPGTSTVIRIWVGVYSDSSYKPSYLTDTEVEFVIFKDAANGFSEDIIVTKPAVAEWQQVTFNFSALMSGVFSIYARPVVLESSLGSRHVLIGPIEIL